MLVRYSTSKDGKPVKQAEVYTFDEHGISPGDIDPDAVKIARRLQASGHVAYVVGGAVRDLMVGKKPKDFDIATDASPSRLRKLFRNSRVIGRRFRLVHIFFENNKVIEVSTFRSENSEGFKNEYGAIEQDVRRRDFSMNALYYCPADRTIIDYVGGVRDIRKKRIVPLIPLDRIFVEDPVRIIRAVKYANVTGFKIGYPLHRQIRKNISLLADCPASRMTEEVYKILLSGRAASVFQVCRKYDIFQYMVPALDRVMENEGPEFCEKFFAMMKQLDEAVAEGEDRRQRAVAYLVADYLYLVSPHGSEEKISFPDAYSELKELLKPLIPANKDVERALVFLIRRRKNYRRGEPLR